MNKNGSFILYQSLKMIYWSSLEQKGSVSPKQESRLVLASFTLYPHSRGTGGHLHSASWLFDLSFSNCWSSARLSCDSDWFSPSPKCYWGLKWRMILSSTQLFQSWIWKLTPNLWYSVTCSDRSRVVFWRTCFQRPGPARIHHPAANSTSGLELKQ